MRDEHAERSDARREFKSAFRDQFMLVLLDPDEALRTLPQLLAKAEDPAGAMALLRELAAAGGPLSEELEGRLARVAEIYEGAAREHKGEASPGAKRAGLKVAAEGGKAAAG